MTSNCDYFYNYKNHTEVKLRFVDLKKDFDVLFKWVHLPHVIPNWKLNKSRLWVLQYFQKAIENRYQSIFIVAINNVEIGYLEIYHAINDRLANFHSVDINDYGLHLFIGSIEALGQGYAEPILCAATDYLFAKKKANRVLVEPNLKVQQLKILESKLGFLNLGAFKMPEKIAYFYVGTKENFYARYPKKQVPTIMTQTKITCDATDWPLLKIHFPNHPNDRIVQNFLYEIDNILKLKRACVVIATFDLCYQYTPSARRHQALWFKKNMALLKNYCLAMIRVTQDQAMIKKITSNSMRAGMPFQCIPADSIQSAEKIALRILKKIKREDYG